MHRLLRRIVGSKIYILCRRNGRMGRRLRRIGCKMAGGDTHVLDWGTGVPPGDMAQEVW